MNYLHILSEDSNDDVFYQSCLAKLMGKAFDMNPTRLRKQGGIAEVRKRLPSLLVDIQRTGEIDNTYFLIAIDNDRSPMHPVHVANAKLSKLSGVDKAKTCRYCEINQIIEAALGGDRNNWPIQGAIAIPVKMIESWQLLICNATDYKQERSLPIFPTKKKSAAKKYYAFANVPDQLKDLVTQERIKLNMTPYDFCRHCTEQFNPADLIKRSLSFALFAKQVANW